MSTREISNIEAAIRAANQNKSNFKTELLPALDRYAELGGSWPYLIAMINLAGFGESLDPLAAMKSYKWGGEIVDYDEQKYPFAGVNPIRQRIKEAVIVVKPDGSPMPVGYLAFRKLNDSFPFEFGNQIVEKPTVELIDKKKVSASKKIEKDFADNLEQIINGSKRVSDIWSRNQQQEVKAILNLQKHKFAAMLYMNNLLADQENFNDTTSERLYLLSPKAKPLQYLRDRRDDLSDIEKIAIDILFDKSYFRTEDYYAALAIAYRALDSTVHVPTELYVGDFFPDINEVLSLPDDNSFKVRFVNKGGLASFQGRLEESTLPISEVGNLMRSAKPKEYRLFMGSHAINFFANFLSMRSDYSSKVFSPDGNFIPTKMSSLPVSKIKNRPYFAVLSRDQLDSLMDFERWYDSANNNQDRVILNVSRETFWTAITSAVISQRKLEYLQANLDNYHGGITFYDENESWIQDNKLSYHDYRNKSHLPTELFDAYIESKDLTPSRTIDEIVYIIESRLDRFQKDLIGDLRTVKSDANFGLFDTDFIDNLDSVMFVNNVSYLEMALLIKDAPAEEYISFAKSFNNSYLMKMSRWIPNHDLLLPSELQELNEAYADSVNVKLEEDLISDKENALAVISFRKSLNMRQEYFFTPKNSSREIRQKRVPNIVDVGSENNMDSLSAAPYAFEGSNSYYYTASDIEKMDSDFGKINPVGTMVLKLEYLGTWDAKNKLSQMGFNVNSDYWKVFKNTQSFDYITDSAKSFIDGLYDTINPNQSL